MKNIKKGLLAIVLALCMTLSLGATFAVANPSATGFTLTCLEYHVIVDVPAGALPVGTTMEVSMIEETMEPRFWWVITFQYGLTNVQPNGMLTYRMRVWEFDVETQPDWYIWTGGAEAYGPLRSEDGYIVFQSNGSLMFAIMTTPPPGWTPPPRRGSITVNHQTPCGTPVGGAPWNISKAILPDDFFENYPGGWQGNLTTVWGSGSLAGIEWPWNHDIWVTEATNEQGVVVFDDLEPGVYLVTLLEILYEGDTAGWEPECGCGAICINDLDRHQFLVSVPMYMPNRPEGDRWVYDINVFPKQAALEPIIGKRLVPTTGENEIDHANSTGTRAIVNWELYFDIRSSLADIDFVEFFISLDPRLSRPGLTIEFDTVDGPRALPREYWDIGIGSGDNSSGLHPESIEAGINRYGLAYILEHGFIAGQFNIGAPVEPGFVRITVPAFVEDFAGNEYHPSSAGHIFNDASWLRYGADLRINFENPGPYATVYALQVISASNGANLEGAVFHLYRAADMGYTDRRPIRVLSSGADGTVTTYGLLPGEYYLVHTGGPFGFPTLTSPVPVTVSEDTADQDYVVSVTIANAPNFVLPLTGGAGTVAFTIIGLALIGGAIAFLVGYMKKKAAA